MFGSSELIYVRLPKILWCYANAGLVFINYFPVTFCLLPKCRLRVIWGLFHSCGTWGLMARSWKTATYWILFLGAGDSVMNPSPYCHWTQSRASFMFQMSWVKRSLWFDENMFMEIINKLTGIPRWLRGKESACQCRGHRRCGFHPWVRKIPWRRTCQPTPVFLGFLGDADGKESTCNAGDLGSIPGSGRSSGEGNGSPLQYSCLENSMDRGAWQATECGVAKSQAWLSNWACTHRKRMFKEILRILTALYLLASFL